jgi:tetratricopeptide (TPR) repeat protein
MMILQVLDSREPATASTSALSRLAVQWHDASRTTVAEGCLAIDLSCNRELQASLLEALGDAYVEYGAYEQAICALTECVEIRIRLFTESHITVALTRRRLACALRYAGKWGEAYKEIGMAIETLHDLLGSSNVLYADALLERAIVHLMAHQLDKARSDAVESRKLFEAKGDIRRFQSMDVEARVIEICAAESAGTLEPAREIYRQILESTELSVDHPWRPTFLHNEGTILHALGNYVGARDNFTKAIKAWECGSDPRPEQIDAYINRGRASRALKDFKAARADVESALRLDTKLRGPRHPYVAYDLVGFARVLIEEDRGGNFNIALKSLDDAIAIYRENGFQTHGYLEAALRRRFELTQNPADKEEAERIREALKNTCNPSQAACS